MLCSENFRQWHSHNKKFLENFIRDLRKTFGLKSELAGVVSTNGFYSSLERCCRRHGIYKKVYRFFEKAPWEVSDLYDYELLEMAIEYGIIQETDIFGTTKIFGSQTSIIISEGGGAHG